MHNATTSSAKRGTFAETPATRGVPVGRLVALALAFISGGAALLVVQLSMRRNDPPIPPVAQDTQQSPPRASNADRVPPLAPQDASTDRVEPQVVAPPMASDSSPTSLDSRWLPIPGILEPRPGAFVRLPLATPQPVAFVDVQPGDKVEKGWQVFSHWESPERLHAMKNEWERAKKQLELAKIRATASDQTLARLEKLGASVSSQELQDAQATSLLRRGEVEAAELSVSETNNRYVAMEFEFKQAFVTSPIEGIVASVDVVPGERRQVGGAFRGVTIINPQSLACRIAVPTKLASQLRADLLAQRTSARIACDDVEYPGTLTTVGVLADSASGLVPVWLDVPNDDGKLFCGGRVEVRFERQLERKP